MLFEGTLGKGFAFFGEAAFIGWGRFETTDAPVDAESTGVSASTGTDLGAFIGGGRFVGGGGKPKPPVSPVLAIGVDELGLTDFPEASVFLPILVVPTGGPA